MNDNSKITRIVLLVIAVILLGGLFVWQGISGSDSGSVLENPPSIPPYVIGSLTAEQKEEVMLSKNAILDRISSGSDFSRKEKETVSMIIQTLNHIYKFSNEDVEIIKEKLK